MQTTAEVASPATSKPQFEDMRPHRAQAVSAVAVSYLALDRAPQPRIVVTDRDGIVTLTGTAATLVEKNRAGLECWAIPATYAVYNDIVLLY